MCLLSGVDFSCSENELIILKGRNGIGKTTLLTILSALQAPASGELTFLGKNITEHRRIYWNNLHYISHNPGLELFYTVKQQLQYWGGIYRTEALVEAALQYMQLSPFRDYRVHYLSEGWKKRLAYARLLVAPKNVWILDEPFAYLDEEGRELVLSLIATRCDQKGAVIISNNQDADLPFGREIDLSQYEA